MGTVVGLLLVVIAGATIIGVLWFVMREQHVHEEHYIPQAVPPTPDRTNTSTLDRGTETAGAPEQNNADTSA
jgi:hypothetical protein